MRERASSSWARLRRRPEVWLLLVILIVGTLFSLAAPGFLTLPNIIDLLETYSVHGDHRDGPLRRAGFRRDRHLLRRDGLGGAVLRRAACRPGSVSRHQSCILAGLGVGVGARLPQRRADPSPADHLDHHDDRDDERQLLAADVFLRRALDLRPARLVDGAHRLLPRGARVAATSSVSPCRSWSWPW